MGSQQSRLSRTFLVAVVVTTVYLQRKRLLRLIQQLLSAFSQRLPLENGNRTPRKTTPANTAAAVTAASSSNYDVIEGKDATPLPSARSLSLERKFNAAVERWKAVRQYASETQARELYGLYKHVVNGPCTDDCPSPGPNGDDTPLWKWESWASVTGTRDEAMGRYASIVWSVKDPSEMQGGELKGDDSDTDARIVESSAAATAESVESLFRRATQYLRDNGDSLNLNSSQLLKFYGWYKRVEKGPVNTPKPGFFSMPDVKAKWSAWSEASSLTGDDAMQAYVAHLSSLCPEWSQATAASSTQPSSQPRKRKGTSLAAPVSTLAEGQQEHDGTTASDWIEKTGIHDAASRGDLAAVREALRAGVSVDVQDEDGMTALMWACEGSQLEVVQLLLEQGPDLSLTNEDGLTALHHAIAYAEIARLLVAAGADITARDSDGISCIEMCNDDMQGDERISEEELRRLAGSTNN